MDALRILAHPDVNKTALEARAKLGEEDQSLFTGVLQFVLETSDVDTLSAPGFNNDPTALEAHFAQGVAKGVAQALYEKQVIINGRQEG